MEDAIKDAATAADNSKLDLENRDPNNINNHLKVVFTRQLHVVDGYC